MGQVTQHELHRRQDARFSDVQLRISGAAAKIDAAALLIRSDIAEAQRIYDEGGALDMETRLPTSATAQCR